MDGERLSRSRGINRGEDEFSPRTVDAEITRQLRPRGRERGAEGREMQYLKSWPCTLIPDSRNLYDLYSITHALGRSYVTAANFSPVVLARIIRGYLHAAAIR